jgi:hypothetical protein
MNDDDLLDPRKSRLTPTPATAAKPMISKSVTSNEPAKRGMTTKAKIMASFFGLLLFFIVLLMAWRGAVAHGFQQHRRSAAPILSQQ